MSFGSGLEVAGRVAQPVGVVDPQAVDEPLGEPSPDLDVAWPSNTCGSSTRRAASVLTAKKRR